MTILFLNIFPLVQACFIFKAGIIIRYINYDKLIYIYLELSKSIKYVKIIITYFIMCDKIIITYKIHFLYRI